MAASLQGHQVHPNGRTWKTHFPKGDLWVFGYGSLIWKPPPHYGKIMISTLESGLNPKNKPESNLNFPGNPKTAITTRNKPADNSRGVFNQASTDHRGTPEQPGRVVTVIEREFWKTLDDPLAKTESESASTKVWGAAYHIPASHAEEVHDYLDEREVDGYSAHFTPFYPVSASGSESGPETITDLSVSAQSSTCMVYIGQPSNPQFLREYARREPQDVAQVISAGHGASGKNTEYLFLLEKALEGIGLGSADVHVTDLVRRVKGIEARSLAEREEEEAEREVERNLAGEPEGERRGSIE
ncbi:hypothetical protein N7478_002148 [Penicillium angulare]|uniref:uncharacterized protein n=1 Tax=Penicillium angulare TaxID=116970 RepID=UPI002541CA4F|nr:uncharacterized protein N7478_002148 [Penicillium angulare]KAJ5289118.1 hypothetical protein N7478_002148 [Penicillium angulare]